MRDAGTPSRRERSKLANTMAKTVQEKMAQWTDDNFVYYQEVMNIIREGSPVQWAKLYHEAIKLGLDKTTNINISINRDQDRANLQALVRSRIPASLPHSSPTAIPVSSAPAHTVPVATVPVDSVDGKYTPYVEIPNTEQT